MRIPMGNFGFKGPDQVQHGSADVRLSGAGIAAVDSAAQRLANTGMSIAAGMLNDERQQNEALARARAGNAVLDREIQIKTLNADLEQKLADGSLRHDQAVNAYTTALQKLEMPTVDGMDAVTAENFNKGLKRVEFMGMSGIQQAAEKAKRVEFKGQTDGALDRFGKLAGMPGAEIDKINGQVDALDPIGQVAYGQNWGKVKQDFKDRNWFNQAQARSMSARDSLEDLQTLEKELSDANGYYAGRLDTEKRNVLMSSVISHRMRLESKIQLTADRREAAAERTIGKIDQQIASGVPATPDMWVQWEKETLGTTQAEAFRDRIRSEEEVQRLLREPPEKQAAFLQEREATLLNGGGALRERANLDRLKRVVDNTRKQLQESPLLFAQGRTGEPVKPLDLGMLLDPERGKEVAGLIGERVATVAALRSQYGDSVKARVLLPNEAEALGRTLDKLAPDQQVEIFRAMRQTIGDDVTYQGTLSQIAPDSPVKALAGALAARGTDYVKSNVFSPDETIAARQTAQFALLGESLLNPTKGQKAADGKTNTWIMPKKADMLRRFNDRVGDTFAGTPQAMDSQFEFVQATYAGLLASRGGAKNPEVIDSALFEQAIERTTPVMKQGGASFLKPAVGMSDDHFREKLRSALPDDLKPQYDRLPLRNVRSNQYVILNGTRPLTDAAGNPLIVTVQP